QGKRSQGLSDVVIERRPVNLAEVFPDEAPQGREGDGGPVVQPVRASGVEVDVSMVRVRELVGIEVVVVELPPFAEVSPPGLRGDVLTRVLDDELIDQVDP